MYGKCKICKRVTDSLPICKKCLRERHDLSKKIITGDLTIHPEDPFLKEKCQQCKKNDSDHIHTCPYKVDINDDMDSMCNCCDGCRQECADDI